LLCLAERFETVVKLYGPQVFPGPRRLY
jgi:hypothetical protein